MSPAMRSALAAITTITGGLAAAQLVSELFLRDRSRVSDRVDAEVVEGMVVDKDPTGPRSAGTRANEAPEGQVACGGRARASLRSVDRRRAPASRSAAPTSPAPGSAPRGGSAPGGTRRAPLLEQGLPGDRHDRPAVEQPADPRSRPAQALAGV